MPHCANCPTRKDCIFFCFAGTVARCGQRSLGGAGEIRRAANTIFPQYCNESTSLISRKSRKLKSNLGVVRLISGSERNSPARGRSERLADDMGLLSMRRNWGPCAKSAALKEFQREENERELERKRGRRTQRLMDAAVEDRRRRSWKKTAIAFQRLSKMRVTERMHTQLQKADAKKRMALIRDRRCW